MSIFNKRQVSLIAAFLGVALFAGAALADLALGSGYQQLKDSIKQTTGSLLVMQDYTMTFQVEVAVDGKILEDSLSQFSMDEDSGISAQYSRSMHALNSVERVSVNESWSYDNLQTGERISWSSADASATGQVYYQANIGVHNLRANITVNPFDDPVAQDLEKVFDALVGSLSNLVQVGSFGEGKEFSGTLNEAQVPLVIQALASYMGKELSGAYDEEYVSGSSKLLPFTKEARVDKVMGRARTDATGSIRDLSFELVLTGSDLQGAMHQMQVLLSFTLDQVGTTTLSMPDLEDQQVVDRQSYTMDYDADQVMQDYMAGEYRADIVLDQGDKLSKVGERHLTVEVDAEEVRGFYRETWLPGYEEYAADGIDELEFTVPNTYVATSYSYTNSVFGIPFSSSGTSYNGGGQFSVTDSEGQEWSGFLNLHSAAGSMDLFLNGAADAALVYLPLLRVFE